MSTTRAAAAASLTRVNAFVMAYLEAVTDCTGDKTMPLQQLRLLVALAVHETLPQTDLERYTGVGKTSNGRNIDRLGGGSFREAGLELVTSETDEKDRRYKLVRLTPKGRAVMSLAAEKVAAFFGA